MRTGRLGAALALLLIPSLAQADPRAPSGMTRAVFTAGEAAGDARGALAELLEVIAEEPDSPLAWMALSRLDGFARLTPGGDEAVAEALDAVWASPRLTSGWARDRIAALRVDHLRRRGELAAAQALAESRGYVRRWLGIGPFGYAYRSGLHRATEVERDLQRRAPERGASYEGRREKRRWRSLNDDTSPFDLGPSLLPVASGGGVLYALAQVRVEAACDAWLTYDGPSAKLFLNRVAVAVVDRERELLPQTLRVRVTLTKGWNRLVVKLPGGGMGFQMRLSDLNGAPFAHEQAAGDEIAEVAPGAAPESLDMEPCAMQAGLAKMAGWSVEHRVAYALYLMSEARLSEAGMVELEAALASEAASASPWIQQVLGVSLLGAEHLPATVRVPRARQAFEAAIALAGGVMQPARRQLAMLLLQASRPVDAIEALEAARALAPADLDTGLDLYRAYRRQGWLGEAEALLGELLGLAPALPALLDVRAGVLWSEGRHDEAMVIYEGLYAGDRRRSWVLSRARQLAFARGDLAGARAILERERDATPWAEVAYLQNLAGIERAAGELDKELEVLRALIERQPERIDRLEALGRRLAELPGREREAIDALRSVLLREPGRHATRRLAEALEAEIGAASEAIDLKALGAISVEELLALRPAPGAFTDASVVCLFDQEVLRIFEDGSNQQVITQAFLIQDVGGIEEVGARPEIGETLAIQTIRPNGEVLEPIRTSGGGFEMPGLEPGAIVLHSYASETGPADFQFSYGPWWFQDTGFSQPFMLSRFVVIAPKRAGFETEARHMPEPVESSERGSLRKTVWEMRGQPRVVPERYMPEAEEVLPHVRMFERRRLDELVPFYADLALGQSFVTPSVEAAAAEAVGELTDPRAKAEALFRFTKERLKGAGGGRTAAEMLAARAGDALVVYRALLMAAGIPFDEAVASFDPALSELDWSRAEFGQFSTRLLRLEFDGEPLYIYADGPKLMPFGRLPEQLWGGAVLLLGPEREGLERLPTPGSRELNETVTSRVELLEGGAARISRREVTERLQSYGTKEVIGNVPRERVESILQQGLSRELPGARITELRFSELEAPGVPLTTETRIEAPGYVRAQGQAGVSIPLGLPRLELQARLGGRPERRFDIVLGSWLARVDVIEIDPGPYAIPVLPEPRRIARDWMTWSLTFRRVGGMLRVERRFELRPSRVPVSEYRDYTRILETIDAAEAERLTVEPR